MGGGGHFVGNANNGLIAGLLKRTNPGERTPVDPDHFADMISPAWLTISEIPSRS
jgi:hypothetical protein